MTVVEPLLAHVRVHDVMHTGLLMVDADATLVTAAKLMAAQRVHTLAVADPHRAGRPIALLTAAQLVAALASDDEGATVGSAAQGEMVTIPSSDSVWDAAELMRRHGADHLLVIEAASGHPAGILSAFDIASACAA